MSNLFLQAVLAPIVESKFLSTGVVVICVIQLVSMLTHSNLWSCPMLRFTSIPCPGCGISRGVASFFCGDFRLMSREYLLAPGFVIGAVLCSVSAIVSGKIRLAMAQSIAKVETRVPVTTVFLSAVMLYWVARLMTGSHPDLR